MPRVICSASAAAEIVPAVAAVVAAWRDVATDGSRSAAGATVGRGACAGSGHRRRSCAGRIGERRMIGGDLLGAAFLGAVVVVVEEPGDRRRVGDVGQLVGHHRRRVGRGADARWIVSPVVAATLPTLARARREATLGRHVHRSVADDRRRRAVGT